MITKMLLNMPIFLTVHLQILLAAITLITLIYKFTLSITSYLKISKVFAKIVVFTKAMFCDLPKTLLDD